LASAGWLAHCCGMATVAPITIAPIRHFAEQVMIVEGILQESGITTNFGRHLYVLATATHFMGVTQQEIVQATGLPKYAISKIVGSLVDAGLMTQERESRKKRLFTTDSGSKLMSRVRASMKPHLLPDGKEKVHINPFADLL